MVGSSFAGAQSSLQLLGEIAGSDQGHPQLFAAAARRSGRPPILVGLPMLAGLSIVHGTIPPHPAAR